MYNKNNYNNIDNIFPKNIYASNQKINNIHITSREFDVLACLIGGCSSKKTALLLSISPKTVENHIRNIMLKFNCNSRDNIINYIEKSVNFSMLKEHYVNILINNAFERELKKIAVFFKNKDFNTVKLYYPKEQEQQLFKLQLEKHLKLAGISACHIEFVEQLNDDCIDAINQENYCLLTFEILKKLLPDCNIEKNIEEFKRQFNIFNPSSIASQDSKSFIEKTNINNNFKYYNIILITFIATITVLFGLFILYIDKKTKCSEYNLQKTVVAFNTIAEEQIIFRLPPRNKHFTGREDYLTKIRHQLNKQQFGVITQIISGLGGVGKTQLATEFAYRALETKEYAAVFFIFAENKNSINSSYQSIADYLQLNVKGLSSENIQDIVNAKLVNLYKNSEILFVLDNVSDHNYIRDYLENIYKKSPSLAFHILITTRSQNWPETPLILNAFSTTESLIFVKKYLPTEQEESINKLITAMHFFPLAMSQAVAYIKNHTNIDDYLELYASKQIEYLDNFSGNRNQYNESLWKTWNISLNKLNNISKEILFMSAYLDPDDVPLDFFEHLTLEEEEFAIEELRKYSFITLTQNSKSFKIHRLLQEVIRLSVKFDSNIVNKNGLLCDILKTNKYWLTKVINQLGIKFDYNFMLPDKWNDWRRYLNQVQAIGAHIMAIPPLLEEGLKILIKFAMYTTYIQYDGDNAAEQWCNILNLTQKYFIGKVPKFIIANINNNLSYSKKCSGKLQEAKSLLNDYVLPVYMQQIYSSEPELESEHEFLDLLRIVPFKNMLNINGEIKIMSDLNFGLLQLGDIYYREGFIKEAIKTDLKALNIFEERNLDDISNYYKIDALWSLGRLYIYSGEFDKSEIMMTKVFQEMEGKHYANNLRQAYIYANWAFLMEKIGKFKEALTFLDKSAKIRTNILSPYHIHNIDTWIKLGFVNYFLGDIVVAEQNFLNAEQIMYKINKNDYGNTYFVGAALGLWKVYESLGEYNKASHYMQTTLKLAQSLYKTNINSVMSFQLTEAEIWPKFIKQRNVWYWQQALEINKKIFGDRHYQTAKSHYMLGLVIQHKYNKINYQQALSILSIQKIRHPNLKQFYLKNTKAIETKINL